MRKIKQLYDTYNFPGFQAEHKVDGVFGDPYAVVLRLRRRGKKRFAGSADVHTGRFTKSSNLLGKFLRQHLPVFTF